MDLDEFWALIERSQREAADPQGRARWLREWLRRRPAAEIEDFRMHLDSLRKRVDTGPMWGAARLICEGLCADDGFLYFQSWLIGQGRDVYERVADEPDELATVPAVRTLAGRLVDDLHEDEWPDWDSLDHVADEAYESVTGRDLDAELDARGHDVRLSLDPESREWPPDDPAELARQYPQLTALFSAALFPALFPAAVSA